MIDRVPSKKSFRNFIIFIIVLLVVYSALSVKFAIDAKQQALQGKTNLEQALEFFNVHNFEQARLNIDASNMDFRLAHKNILKMYLWRPLPWVGTQLKTVNLLLDAGINLTDAVSQSTVIAQDIVKEFADRKNLSYAGITKTDKKMVLGKISASQPQLAQIKNKIDKAIADLDRIPNTGVTKQLADKIAPIKAQMPQIKTFGGKILPLLLNLPQLVGYPDGATYLVLLQNNDELRPTGGFIGTYGILKINNGDIDQFQTDNIYNIDDPAAKKGFSVVPPAPLVKYLNAKNWYMRDANWSPDFPTSAEKTEWFYHQEGGPEQKFDGVIATTPTYIASLLKVIGNQKVDGLTFTSENIQDMLENRVGKDYYTLGIPEPQRKSIVGQLGVQIKEELFKLPLKDLAKVGQATINALEEKQFLIYSKHPDIENQLAKNNWNAVIRQTPNDYLFVVDTNIASLKSDRVIDRKIDYTVKPEGSDLVAKLILTYKNNGYFTWKLSRLRSWTRVYVPQGSQLISVQGLMDNDRSTKPGQVETYDEFGKTVFAGFIAIEPGETRSLTYEYRLPTAISAQVYTNGYNLIVQKQAGTPGTKLGLSLEFSKKINDFSPSDFGSRRDGANKVLFSTDLKVDKEFTVSF